MSRVRAQHSALSTQHWYPAGLGLLLLGAWALRLVGVGEVSLDGDEAFSAQMAVRPLGEILATLARHEPHPPLYYAGLAGWTRLAGTSELALRIPSTAAGLLLIALLYQVGRLLGGRSLGLVAALVVAVNAYQIWYAQEARMYVPSAAFGLAGLVAALQGLQTGRRRWYAAAALSLCLAALTHYYAVFLGAGLALLVAARLLHGRRWLELRWWLGSLAVAGLLYLPWLLYAGQIIARHQLAPAGTIDFGRILGEAAIRYSLGLGADPNRVWPVTLFWLALAGLGLATLGLGLARAGRWTMDDGPWTVDDEPSAVAEGAWTCDSHPPSTAHPPSAIVDGPLPTRHGPPSTVHGPSSVPGGWDTRFAAALLVGYLVIPILGGLLVSLSRPMFEVRYFMVAAPALYLLVAAGMLGLWRVRRWLGALAGLILIPSLLIPLADHLQNPGRKSDFRSVATAVLADLRPGDAIVLDGHSQGPQFWYYFRHRAGEEGRYPHPNPLPEGEGTDGVLPEGEGIRSILAGAEGTGAGLPEGEGTGGALPTMEGTGGVVPAGIEIGADSGSALSTPYSAPSTQYSARSTRDSRLATRDSRLGDSVPAYVLPDPDRPPEEALEEIMRRHSGVWLLDYDVGAYDPERRVERYLATQHALTLTRRPAVSRVNYYTSASYAEAASHPAPADVRLGPAGGDPVLRLVETREPAEAVRPGDFVPADLVWEALAPVPVEYAVSRRLFDSSGRVVWQRDGRPAAGFAPTTEWLPGGRVIDRAGLIVPDYLPPGTYRLVAVVYPASGGEPARTIPPQPGDQIPLGEVSVLDGRAPNRWADPPVTQRLGPSLTSLRLIGWRLPEGELRPGSRIDLTLLWTAVGPVAPNAQLVVTLATGARIGEVPAGPPDYPPATWPAGRRVLQVASLHLPPTLESGRYQVLFALSGAGLTSGSVPAGELAIRSRPRTYTAPATGNPRAIRFGDVIQLSGFDLDQSPSGEAGRSRRLGLVWQALRTPEREYHLFVHLVDPTGRIVAQRDLPPGGEAAPTTGWLPGEYLRTPVELALPESISGGEYQILVGLYDPQTGQRLITEGADHVELTRLTIGP